VVLPLLRDAFVTPGWISDAAFLAGYGAAQAVPGPLFSFAAYLGAAVDIRPHGLAGAALGLLAAALYDPVWSRSVMTPADAAVALLGFALLTFWRAPPLLVVVLGALAGIGLSLTRAAFA